MEKIEYSDINKFLVSVGITLIIIAFLLPWLYLREPFDLILTQDQISKLTKDAQIIIAIRQGFILQTISYVQFATIGLFILGSISITVGLWRWFVKQKDLDKRELIITARHEYEYKQLTEEEVAKKAEDEFEALKQDTTNSQITTQTTIVRDEFIPNYLQLERSFFNKLVQFFQNDFKIYSNRRIDKYEYDIILENRQEKHLDYIFEIKYYPKQYSKTNLQEAVLRLGKSTQSYIEVTRRQAKPILVIIVHRGDFSETELKELKTFTSTNLQEFSKISLGIISFDEFEELNKQKILNLLNYV